MFIIKRQKVRLMVSIFLLVIMSLVSATVGKTIYVDNDANGLNNGSSWTDAYKYLQDALDDANSSAKANVIASERSERGNLNNIIEIRVAQGMYRPDESAVEPNGTGNRESTFLLINGVTIKGGYAGAGYLDPNTRDIHKFETILSGDLDGNDIDVSDPCDLLTEPTRVENSYHVVTGSMTDATAVLDGFIIAAGNDNHYIVIYGEFGTPLEVPAGCGGGMYNNQGSPVLTNCIFRWNTANLFGGAIYNEKRSSPMLTNCTFTKNSADDNGGGIFNWNLSSPNMINCTFVGNMSNTEGGAMYIYNSVDQKIINCVFKDNSARYFGGGILVGHCSPLLISCIFSSNKTEWHRYGGGGVQCENEANPTFVNCEFSGNIAGERGGGVSNTVWSNPKFLNCIFTGNSASKIGGGIWNRGKSNAILINCIFWGNKAPQGQEIAVAEVWNGSDPSIFSISYSDIQGGKDTVYVGSGCGLNWGAGNINLSPLFASPGYWDPNGTPQDPNDDFWVDGDYHLKSQAGRWDADERRWMKDEVTSPCIDAGDPASPVGLEPFPNGGIINMGAYGGTAEASKSYFDKPPCETIVAGDINGDCIVNLKDFAIIALHWLEEH